MQSLTNSLLIDFSEMDLTPELKEYHNQVYSSIKLYIADLEKYQKVDSFIECQNKKCKMILTVQDKGQIIDYEQVQSNQKAFPTQIVQKLAKNKFSTVLWICNFCSTHNVINRADLKFAKNKTRLVVKQKDNQSKDPILLIVFDISGSMEEQVKLKKQQNNKKEDSILSQIQKTQIYKKIVEDEKQEQKLICQEVEKKNNQNLKQHNKYEDHLKKNKLLMGLTEYLIGKICPQQKNITLKKFISKVNLKSDQIKKDYKNIGFVFFNSNVFISIPSQNENKIVYLYDKNSQTQTPPPRLKQWNKQKVNFDDFQSLFKIGDKYGNHFKTKVQDFKFQKLDLKSLSDYAQGQSALGPAIATAVGIANQHGHGSSIVVVTDGYGNRGIFDQTQTWQQASKMLKMKLQKNRCFLTILQLRKTQGDKKLQTSLDKFCAKDPNYKTVRKINVFQQNTTISLDDYQKKLKQGINRNDLNWTNQVRIRAQHKLIKYDKSQQVLTKKLLNQSQPCHIQPDKFDFKLLKEKDYLHPFMTQVIIKYENTRNKQQSVFMTYIIQKFVKYSQMKERDIKILDSQKTFFNVMEYLNAEQQNYDLQNIPLGLIKRSFRDTISMRSMGMKTLRFPSIKSTNAKNEGWTQNVNQYQNDYLLKKQEKKSKKQYTFGMKEEKQQIQEQDEEQYVKM